jgi:hypothetical protein
VLGALDERLHGDALVLAVGSVVVDFEGEAGMAVGGIPALRR